MNLTNMMFGERNFKRKSTCCVFPFIEISKTNKTKLCDFFYLTR